MSTNKKRSTSDAIAALSKKLDKSAAPACKALVIELPTGPIVLMSCPYNARCAKCDDARARQRAEPDAPKPKPLPRDQQPDEWTR